MTPEETLLAVQAVAQEPSPDSTCTNPGAVIEQVLIALMGQIGASVKEAICSEVAGLHGLTAAEISRIDEAINALSGDSDLATRITALQEAIDTLTADENADGIFDLVAAANNALALAQSAQSDASNAVTVANQAVASLNQFQASYNLTITNINVEIRALQVSINNLRITVQANTGDIAQIREELESIGADTHVSEEELRAAVCASYQVISDRLVNAYSLSQAAFTDALLNNPCPVLSYGEAPPAAPEEATTGEEEEPPAFS